MADADSSTRYTCKTDDLVCRWNSNFLSTKEQYWLIIIILWGQDTGEGRKAGRVVGTLISWVLSAEWEGVCIGV